MTSQTLNDPPAILAGRRAPTNSSTAQLLAEKIRVQAELNHSPFAGFNLRATISLGLTELQPEDSLDSLIGPTDRALYRGKESIRNRLCINAGCAQ